MNIHKEGRSTDLKSFFGSQVMERLKVRLECAKMVIQLAYNLVTHCDLAH